MKLNPFEKKLVQHPLRFWLQNHIEAPLLTSMMPKPLVYIQQALEIGCGFGNGIHLIREHFGAEHVTAVDLDPEMVSAAKARWQSSAHGLEQLDFSVADATALPLRMHSLTSCLILRCSTIFLTGNPRLLKSPEY